MSLQMPDLKRRNSCPSATVASSSSCSVLSVCMRSFASACHSAQMAMIDITACECAAFGIKSSNAGIAHYDCSFESTKFRNKHPCAAYL